MREEHREQASTPSPFRRRQHVWYCQLSTPASASFMSSTPFAKHCRYCASALPTFRTRYCSACKQWQFPFAFVLTHIRIADIPLYGSVIALLVTTFSFSIFGKEAELHLASAYCRQYGADIVVYNRGNSEGILTNARLQAVEGSRAGDKLFVSLLVQGARTVQKADEIDDQRTSIIPPGEGRIIQLRLLSSRVELRNGDPDLNSSLCQIKVHFAAHLSLDASPTPFSKDLCQCSDFVASI